MGTYGEFIHSWRFLSHRCPRLTGAGVTERLGGSPQNCGITDIWREKQKALVNRLRQSDTHFDVITSLLLLIL